jgi:predicted RNase H-like nuclease
MVAIFNLPLILKYKAKPNRTYEERYKAFARYQSLLRRLPDIEIPKEILGRDVKGLKASTLKEYEDVLDAIFCAYIAYYAWKHPKRCAVLGSMREGYILTPTVQERPDPVLGRSGL